MEAERENNYSPKDVSLAVGRDPITPEGVRAVPGEGRTLSLGVHSF